MRFLCVQCDAPFEAEDSDKPRCPSCLRTQGLRAIDAPSPEGARRARWPWLVAAAAVCAAAAGAYYTMGAPADLEGPVPLTPLDADVLAARLAKANVDAGAAIRLFDAGSAVQAFAKRAVGSETTPDARAKALVAAIQARGAAKAFVDWSRVDARPVPAVRGAEETATALAEDGARHELFPLEVAALGVAALRSLGEPAMLAEVHAFPEARAPADPSGRIGYFAPALPTKDGGHRVYDVYGGNSAQPAAADFSVLDDVAAVGTAMSLSGLVALSANEEPSVAVALVDGATSLAPSSPTVRGARATVLLSSSGTDEGVREMQAAAQLRRDAPRRNNLAMVYLAQSDRERAAREVSLALEQFPDFAAGRVTLASVHMAGFEREQARAELEQAERLSPRMPMLLLTWAQWHASAGELPQAVARAQAAVALRPENAQTHLTLARMYRQASDFDRMRTEARRVMELIPDSQRERMREIVKAVLGPTALEEPLAPVAPVDAGVDPTAAAAVLPEPGKLDLGKGSSVLGEDAPQLEAPSGLNLNPQGSKLQLRKPGSKLKLDLGN